MRSRALNSLLTNQPHKQWLIPDILCAYMCPVRVGLVPSCPETWCNHRFFWFSSVFKVNLVVLIWWTQHWWYFAAFNWGQRYKHCWSPRGTQDRGCSLTRSNLIFDMSARLPPLWVHVWTGGGWIWCALVDNAGDMREPRQARAKQFPDRPQDLPGTVQPHTLSLWSNNVTFPAKMTKNPHFIIKKPLKPSTTAHLGHQLMFPLSVR